MSDIGSRILQIRKEQGLTQIEFAAKIGLKQTVVGNYEKGIRRVTDRSIADICRVFHVREEWLRSGKEPKMQPVLSKYFSDSGMDDEDKIIINTYLALPQSKRKVFKEYIYQVAEEVIMRRGFEQLRRERKSDDELTVAEKRAIINEELDTE